MFGKQAYQLLQEVSQCPADNLPPFNVSRCSFQSLACRRKNSRLPVCLQEELFRSVIDEVHIQHENLTKVYK